MTTMNNEDPAPRYRSEMMFESFTIQHPYRAGTMEVVPAADYAAATHLLADRDAQIERLTALNSALTDKSNGYVVENARLTAELATLRASAASVQADQRAEIDAANAALDELRADAERYQWLAKHCRSTAEHWGGRWSIIVDGPSPKRHDDEDDFHAAIDAARTLRKGTT